MRWQMIFFSHSHFQLQKLNFNWMTPAKNCCLCCVQSNENSKSVCCCSSCTNVQHSNAVLPSPSTVLFHSKLKTLNLEAKYPMLSSVQFANCQSNFYEKVNIFKMIKIKFMMIISSPARRNNSILNLAPQ